MQVKHIMINEELHAPLVAEAKKRTMSRRLLIDTILRHWLTAVGAVIPEHNITWGGRKRGWIEDANR